GPAELDLAARCRHVRKIGGLGHQLIAVPRLEVELDLRTLEHHVAQPGAHRALAAVADLDSLGPHSQQHTSIGPEIASDSKAAEGRLDPHRSVSALHDSAGEARAQPDEL